MSTQDDQPELPQPVPVTQLPYYESLRILLEPYKPAANQAEATELFTSAEIIAQIEMHHGVPQGAVGKEIYRWIMPDDFVRAMRYLGFREASSGGLQIHWMMKKK